MNLDILKRRQGNGVQTVQMNRKHGEKSGLNLDIRRSEVNEFFRCCYSFKCKYVSKNWKPADAVRCHPNCFWLA